MSFTQDELQALNAIFDQKLAMLRRDLDHSLDQRMHALRREFEQRQTLVLQDLLRTFVRRLTDQQHKSRDGIYQRLEALNRRLMPSADPEAGSALQQQIEDVVERALAAQLLAIETLINQRLPANAATDLSLIYNPDQRSDFDAIEVQTEIPWEDLIELIDKALDERLGALTDALLGQLRDLEHSLSLQIHRVRNELVQEQPAAQEARDARPATDMHDVFASIEQLERLIESMQVAMTANSALLSNRLYHHQQLPLERAHPGQPPLASATSTTGRVSSASLTQHEGDED